MLCHRNPILGQFNRFLSVLPFCRKAHNLEAVSVSNGLIHHDHLLEQFITHCCHLNLPQLALPAFTAIKSPTLSLQNLLLGRLCYNGFFQDVVFLYVKSRNSGVLSDNYTYPFVIKACTSLRHVRVGNSVHSVVLKTGFGGNLVVETALLSFYSRLGEMENARKVFDEILQPDLVAWNALISGYSLNGFDHEALRVFQDLRLIGLKPNASTLTSLLALSSRFNGVGICLHGLAYKLGFMEVEPLLPALISVYTNCGDLLSAGKIFDTSMKNEIAIWNSMISAYTIFNKLENAFSVFQKMLIRGFVPDEISIIGLLSSCSKLKAKATLLGRSAHAFIIRKSIDSNLNVSNALLAFYCDCSDIAYCFRIFDRMVLKNVVSWNTLIYACIDIGESERAMLLLNEMKRDGVNFDSVTLTTIIPACRNEEICLALHGNAVRSALVSATSVANTIVSMYINCGDLDSARLFFNNMPDKTVVSWNAMLTGYRCRNLHNESTKLFLEMMEMEQNPNYITLLSMLPACSTLRQGKSIHAYRIRRMIPLKTRLLTSLMIMYARFGNMKSCMIMFGDGDKTSISLWNTVISAYLLLKDGVTSFSFFRESLRVHMEPDEITVLNLVSICALLNDSTVSNAVLAYLFRKGFDKDVAIRNALIDMYAKCGSISSAEMLFETLPEKDNISWGVMINGYGLHGRSEAALSLYSEMRLLGYKPDKVTYMCVLSACSRGGCIEEGRMVWEDMIRDGVGPGMEHYGCMVDMLGRGGMLKEAYEMVTSLPRELCGNMVESLLGGCMSYGEYGVGEEIGRVMVDMRAEESGGYVMLHNIYAASGKWMEANKVRVLMKVNKTPGSSQSEFFSGRHR